jgi:hypothetical protein
MPRVGIGTADQSTSSQFTFAEGYGEVVSAEVGLHGIPGYDPKVGFFVGIQRLDQKFNPIGDDPVVEFLSAGPTTKFSPCMATDESDADPTLVEALDDDGIPNGATGNCLFSLTGGGPDRKAKISIFTKSLEEFGFPAEKLNGYAPNLIGLKAYFTQQMMEKGDNYSGKNAPTCLAVKDKIIALPGEAVRKVAAPPAVAKKAPVPPVAAPAVRAPSLAPAPVAASPVMPPVARPVAKAAPVAPVAIDINQVAQHTAELMASIAEGKGGKNLTFTKLQSMLVTKFGPAKIPTNYHKPIQELVKNREWFDAQAESLGWGVDGDTLTFPVEEGAGDEAAA